MKYRARFSKIGGRSSSASTGGPLPARVEFLEGRRLLAAAPPILGDAQTVTAFTGPVRYQALEATRPSIRSTTPTAGAKNISPNAYVVSYVNLPNVGGVTDDPIKLAANVRLFRAGDVNRTPIPSKVNTTGGGDAIILTPLTPLAPNTEYQYEISEGLTDTSGAPFQPFTMKFTTGNADEVGPDPNVVFGKVPLPTAAGRRFTGITIGPDDKLYAGTMTGEIVRFDILPDGTLGTPTVINTIRAKNGNVPRIVTGLRFDPASTASNLVLWVTHGDGAEIDAPDFTGKVSRLSGAALGTYQDYVVGLPRSVRDHLTQQMDFKPGTGLMYVSQGSNNSMGEPDNAWGQREEQLLSAAILEVNVGAIAQRIAGGQGALDVRTGDDVATPYDPFAADAPVKLYATGVRNAFDVIWHSNGSLYAPTNGSAPGGNTPAGGGAPALKNVAQNQPDLLFRIRKGKYYGQPNPVRDEFVLNGGNPTSGKDPFEVPAYPVGVQPDENWDPAVYNFGDNRSPNGVIEYKSNAFNGSLKGNLIVAEYSGGDDLVFMKPAANGTIPANSVRRGMVGTSGFVDPLDLVEHVGPGNLYVVEYGANRITLLKPQAVSPQAPRNVGRAVFNDPVGGPASPVRVLSIKSPYTDPITVANITLTGDNADSFRIVNAPTTPVTLAGGATIQVSVEFAPGSAAPLGVITAGLRLNVSEGSASPLELSLRGLATAGEGGALEPSLQRILDLYEIPAQAGDNDPATTDLPLPLASPNTAVDVQTLVKAGSGPVRIEVMSVFAPAASPTMKFGYYNPSSGAQTEVLTVNDSQRTRPSLASGVTEFDPGTGVFGLYAFAGAFGTTSYTQDAKNTFEPNAALRRKALFYPLLDAEGEPVADAFVVAFEEVAGGSDYQDFVAIIRNVRAQNAAPPVPELTVQLNGQEIPSGATVDFGQVQQSAAGPERTITVRNDGTFDLLLSGVTLPSGFELVQGFASTSLAPGATDTIRVRLTTTTAGTFAGQADVFNSDPDEGTFGLRLTGIVTAVQGPPPDPGPGTPTPTPTPPLLTPGVSAKLPAVIIAGSKTAKGTVTVKVQNNNFNSFEGPVTITVSADDVGAPGGNPADQPADAADAVLMTTTKTLKIKAHASKTVKLKFVVPATVPQGEKALEVFLTDTVGTGSVQGQSFRVEAPIVRLNGSTATAPAGPFTFGKPGTVKVPLVNNGTVATTKAPVTYQLLIANTTDPTGATPVAELTATGKVGLKPGQAKSQALKLTIPPGTVPAGSYFLLVRLQAELNETNGQTLVTMPFSVA